MADVFYDDAEAVIVGLAARGMTLSTAESLTGGMIASALVSVSGASRVFSGGIVSYTDEVKIALVGVSSDTVARYTAVSHETAREMAEGVRLRTSTDVGLSTTGSAGPDPCCGVEPGRFFVGVSMADRCDSFEFYVQGDRDRVRAAATLEALKTVLGYAFV